MWRITVVLLGVVAPVACNRADDPEPGADADADAAPDEGMDDGTTPDEAGDRSDAGRKVGDPCVDAAECPAGGSGSPVCLDWPGGYCAVAGCAEHGHDCPDDPGLGGTATTGGKCVLFPDLRCLALCAGNGDCRSGYACTAVPDASGHGTVDVCVPSS